MSRMDRADDSDMGESPAAFNKEHYPNGLNSNFLDGSTSDVVASGVKKFENPETRDIARALPEVMEMLKAFVTEEMRCQRREIREQIVR